MRIYAYEYSLNDHKVEEIDPNISENLVDSSIRIHGISKDSGDSVHYDIPFRPWVYISSKTCLNQDLISRIEKKTRIKFAAIQSVSMRSLYLYGKKRRFYKVFLTKHSHINRVFYTVKTHFHGVTVHESNVPAPLRFTTAFAVPSTGWIDIISNRPVAVENPPPPPPPLIMSFDIEAYSNNPHKIPDSRITENEVFQISCVFGKFKDDSRTQTKILISLGSIDDNDIPGVKIYREKSEKELLLRFTWIIRSYRPIITLGYNVFGFDWPYLIGRAKFHDIESEFYAIGLDNTLGLEREIKWSSSAFGNQEFSFVQAGGLISIDLKPIIERDHRLSNYRLETVGKHLLGVGKDDVSVAEIFQSFEERFTNSSLLTKVGSYCVQDSKLVLDLFNHEDGWFGLVELAAVCQVSVVQLFTRGQGIKVFSQIYVTSCNMKIVVEHCEKPDETAAKFQGAFVFTPVPGAYDNVVSFDFSSLYPSTIISNNICYTTLIPDNVTDDNAGEFYEVAWTEEDGVTKRRYRFTKSFEGVLPKLLREMLGARKKTRALIPTATDDMKSVLDKRQLAFKISANSTYGILGSSTSMLPFRIGAECVTAQGRNNIMLAADVIRDQYGGTLIYGDTDSCYVRFPKFDTATASELWDFCLYVEEKINVMWSEPMKLEFEEAIYKRYFILSKKRYVALKCKRDGVIESKMTIRGVLLTRRDNAELIRNIYKQLVLDIMYRVSFDEAFAKFVDLTLKLIFGGRENVADFVVTKRIGAIGDYKQKALPEDQKKLAKRLAELRLDPETYNQDTLAERQCPAHVQLGENMKRRGILVAPGQRLEFVYCFMDRMSDKLENRIVDLGTFQKFAEYIPLDRYKYVAMLKQPVIQAMTIAYGNGEKQFGQFYKALLAKRVFILEFKRKLEPKVVVR